MPALETLYEQNRPRLFGTALRWIKDAEECQDAVQDAYLIAHRKGARFENTPAFLSWFRETIRYKALERARRRPAYVEQVEVADDRPQAADIVQVVLDGVARNPDEDVHDLVGFYLHTIFGIGHRYLTYTLEIPKTTLLRRFEGIRIRSQLSASELPDPCRAVSVLTGLAYELVREKLMAEQPHSAWEIYALSREILLSTLERFPKMSRRVFGSMSRCINYIYRRCVPDPRLDRERSEVRAGVWPEDERLGEEYSFLRSHPVPDVEAWRALEMRMEKHPTYRDHPIHVTTLEYARGWRAAFDFLKKRIPPSMIRRSFYLNYLSSYYQLRSGRPRIAARYLTQIQKNYCPEFFRGHIAELRSHCNHRWRDGGMAYSEPNRLLA